MTPNFIKTVSAGLLQTIITTSRKSKPAISASVDFSYCVTDLGTLGGSWSYAFSINDAGEVLGHSSTRDGTEHTFSWNNGTITDLGTLDSNGSCANGINITERVRRRSHTSNVSGETLAFSWNNGLMADLSSLDGNYSVANDINQAGHIVGYLHNSTSSISSYHAFLSADGNVTDLGTLGSNYSKAYGINNAGEVVGESLTTSASLHAFLWKNGTMFDLNHLLSSNSGWTLNQALSINNIGQIVGRGTFNGQDRAFLLTPKC
jgi:probable HAF family extracellular repeat protein